MRTHESVTINRPPDEVWAFLANFFNSPRVRPGTLALRRISPARCGRGRSSRAEWRSSGSRHPAHDDRHRVWSASQRGRDAGSATGPRCHTHALEPTLEGTRVDRTSDFELRPGNSAPKSTLSTDPGPL